MRGTAWGSKEPGGSEQEEEPVVDEWLLSVMQNSKNRETLRKLEASLDRFVQDKSLQRLEVPPKSAFQRRIVHTVAVRYNLDNKLITPDSSSASDETRALVLIKTEESAIPKTRLSDIDISAQKPQSVASTKVDAATKPLSIRRRVSASNGGAEQNVQRKGVSSGVIRGVTEEEYNRARARIFQSSTGESVPSTGGEGDVNSQSTVKPRQPLGPVEGSTGFASRRNVQPVEEKRDDNLSQVSAPTPNPSSEARVEDTARSLEQLSVEESSTIPQHLVPDDNDVGRSEGSSGNMKIRSKWEEDVYDPDFDRSYHRWMAPAPIIPLHQHQFSGTPVMQHGLLGAGTFGVGWFPRMPAHGIIEDPLMNSNADQHFLEKGMPGVMDMLSYPNADGMDPAVGFRSGPADHAKGLVVCSQCNGEETTYVEMPSRNANEPTMGYIKCLKCGDMPRADQVFAPPTKPSPTPVTTPQPTQEAQGSSTRAPKQNTVKQSKQTYPVVAPPADYNNVADFPPLGRTVPRSSPENGTGSGIPWEVTRVE